MKNKIIAVALAAAMITVTLPVREASAATIQTSEPQAIVTMLELINTDKALYNSLTSKVTRAQFAQILCNLTDANDSLSNTSTSLYPDVRSGFWAADYIRFAVSKGYMSAYLDGCFKPNQAITLKESVYAILKVLGTSDSEFSGNLTTKVMSLYQKKGLNEAISLTKNQALTKSACIQLIYNTLKTATDQGKIYGELFGCTLDASGEIDDLSLIETKMTDPVIATDQLDSQLNGINNETEYYLNDTKVSAAKIQKDDVVYYFEALNLVFAYRNKVTGTIQAINSELLKPKSVKIKDTTYEFANTETAKNFSALGSVKKGDIVTLILDKNNKIIAYIKKSEDSYSFTGIVLSYEEITKTSDTTDYTLRVVSSDGTEYSYEYTGLAGAYTEGDLVDVAVKNDTATVTKLSYTSKAYSFNESGTKLGSYTLSDDVDILDYYEGLSVKLYPSRLAGCSLTSDDIRYLGFDDAGQINVILLNNYTNDLYSYGMVTGTSYTKNSFSFLYDLYGNQMTTSEAIATQTEVPAGVILKNNEVINAISLYRINIGSLGDGSLINTNGETWNLSEDCVAYLYEDSEFTYVNLNSIWDLSDYELTAYCEKDQSQGGCIRVIVAVKR